MKTIEITIDTKGEVSVQTKGFSGASCKDASKALEEALGIVRSDTATPEMYQSATTPQQLQQSGR